jgi:hypothetical protein
MNDSCIHLLWPPYKGVSGHCFGPLPSGEKERMPAASKIECFS